MKDLRVERVALTSEQVKDFSLPPPLKKTGPKYREYMQEYGEAVWELDALDPQILQSILEERIKRLTNLELWKQREKDVEEKRNQLKEKLVKVFPQYFQVEESSNKYVNG